MGAYSRLTWTATTTTQRVDSFLVIYLAMEYQNARAVDMDSPTNLVGPSASSVDLKKDGTASKMRSHKGNVPVLPKSKLCPHCSATFTRTTHLNRHLRTRESSDSWA